VSDSVLEALARALQFDDAERAHLFDLAHAASPVAPKRRRVVQQRLRPVVLRILESMTAPAIVRNSRVDYLAANPLGRALYAPPFESREQPPNSALFTFLDPAAREFYVDWQRTAKDLVAHLRSEAGRNPYDRGLSDLVGELSTRSEEFGTWWAAHNVRYHRTGSKRLRHPVVGELELEYEVIDVSADDGLTIAVYSAEPGSRSQEALDLLASRTATPDPEPTPPTCKDSQQIRRSSIDTTKGPPDWFTGDVYVDAVATPAGTSTFAAALVHFTPALGPPGTPIPTARPSTSPRAWASANARVVRSR